MSAARRAAAFASLTSEPDLSSYAWNPSALDVFCALSVGVDRACVSDAALAAASADPDAGIAEVARVLLQLRCILNAANGGALPAGASEAAKAAEAEARKAIFPDLSAVAGERSPFAACEDAIASVRQRGVNCVHVPREFLRAIGAVESDAARILRAAFSHDDDAVVRALACDFDVAELRTASRISGPRSLRAGLSTAGDAFRGVEARERAIAWGNRLRTVRRSGRKKRGALLAAVEATGWADSVMLEEAARADSVWAAVENPPPIATRISLLCDAVFELALDDALRLRTFGSSEPDDGPAVGLCFDDGAASAVDVASFAQAIEADVETIGIASLDVRQSMYACAAAWLARERILAERYLWPVAEASARIIAPTMTFSASRLNLFAKCPRRWYYEYLCAAVEETTSAHAVYGKVFHGALETLHRDVRKPAEWDRAVVLDRLYGLLDVAFGAAHHEFASQLEYEVLRLRARLVAQHYIRWLYEEAADAPLEIVEVESRQLLSYGGHRFVGYIDRIDRPPGGGPVTIFDYKTGRIEEDPNEYLRQVRSGEEAQLALYYAMRRAQGDDVARIALVSIRDARAKTWILALDIEDEAGKSVVHRAGRMDVVRASCSIADLERSLDALTARCDLVTRDGVEHFAVGSDPPCSFCAYALACRERPADGERIFAR